MRSGLKRTFALLGTLLLVTLSAGASSAVTTTTSLAYEEADVVSNDLIPAGWASYSDARDCVWDDCQDLENVAFVNVDISQAMASYEDYAQFYVINGFVAQTTLWMVCSYDADGIPVNCWYDEEPGWGLVGELSPDAHTLRLFPVQSVSNEYHLYIYVE